TQQQTGSGLGLTIARSLIELHGGALTVESLPGRGSTFRITLPTYTEED
ncbi:MAG: hybrid sensor histidine kinase/response regulator, partial [Chloroflexi bacterium]|nr:hybrid sensor histidine kinase/response regulator [Chloroflexota bacterium]